MNRGEHDDEPVVGLPGHLPDGERLLWQGRPSWQVLARRAFHADKAAAYCAGLLALDAALIVADGGTIAGALKAVFLLLPLPIACVGLLVLFAWLTARATVYTLTNRRFVLRHGIAISMTLNVPFKVIGSAGLKLNPDGTGDIPLGLLGKERIAYLHLWPYARPWRLTRPEPMLRAVPDATRVAGVLARALVAASPDPSRVRAPTAPAPVAGRGGLAAAAG